MEEYADEIFNKLDNGAHMYFCGLKVHASLLRTTCSYSTCLQLSLEAVHIHQHFLKQVACTVYAIMTLALLAVL
jgi:hypothetical protein